MKRLIAVVTACILLAVAQRAGAADPYEINAIVSATGPDSFLGSEQAQVLGIIEGIVNKNGGIAGRPIKMVIADDQSSPQIAVQLANSVIAKKGAVIIGSSTVALCNAMASPAKNGPVISCLSPGVHPPDG